jgi:hypothetical protein
MAADGTLHTSIDPETGDMIYEYPDTATTTVSTVGHFDNLATETLSSRTNDSICYTLTELLAYDQNTQEGKLEIVTDAYKLLGIGPESDADDAEGDGNTSDHPLMLTALTRFQSKAYAALLPSSERAVRAEPR